jgi:hypothetical protein
VLGPEFKTPISQRRREGGGRRRNFVIHRKMNGTGRLYVE